MMSSPDSNTQWYSLLNNFTQTLRRMSWFKGLICVVYGYIGLTTLWDWMRMLIGQSVNITSRAYTSPFDAVFGLFLCLSAVALLWFTFRTSDMRRYRGLGVSWALILVSWGCQRWLSASFAIPIVDLALILSPFYGVGALLFSGWLFCFHWTKPAPAKP